MPRRAREHLVGHFRYGVFISLDLTANILVGHSIDARPIGPSAPHKG
jgi:hypothetical protein